MIVSVSEQLYVFGLAALMGVALGVLYDVFKVMRLVGLNSQVLVFLEDVLFFAISTVTVFSFYMQITDGKFRVYPLIAASLGFLVYFLTLEKLIFFVIKKLYYALYSFFEFVYKKTVLFAFKKLKALAKFVFKPIGKIFHRFFKENLIIFFKKLLPKRRKMLYNNSRSKRKGKGKVRRYEKEQERHKKAFFC
ncbi:MAG: hypothetical protein IJ027_00760 [Oscillospiraceae bacterium]|nr:hypothetical protein [Oscillospiraceae bacterium]